jgi:hypothetical protein
VDALGNVDVLNETADLGTCVGQIPVLGEVHLLFFDGTHEAFRMPILFGLAYGGHAQSDSMLVEQGHRREPHTARPDHCGESLASPALVPPQGGQVGSGRATAKAPAAHGASEDIQNYRQVHEAFAEANLRDIACPDLIWVVDHP